jgi:hypothetical protein
LHSQPINVGNTNANLQFEPNGKSDANSEPNAVTVAVPITVANPKLNADTNAGCNFIADTESNFVCDPNTDSQPVANFHPVSVTDNDTHSLCHAIRNYITDCNV